jgi:alcohol dehydrogenase YqhD (iron-dependent ADH family)
MLNFEFLSPTKIVFGKGVENRVGELLKQYGAKKVLFHYGGGSIKRIGLYDRVVKSLNDAGVEFVELGGVQPNPRLSLAIEGIELCRRENVDFLLAVGGGSVIDSAKGIGLGVKYEGDLWDFFIGRHGLHSQCRLRRS